MPVIDVNNVIVRKRHRKVNLLMQSIKDTGLINPVILNGNTLVAGAHRLEAYKRLGMNCIAYSHMGDNSNPESMELIEIDENLIRNELSDNERNENLSRRVKLIADRKMSEKIKICTEAYTRHAKTKSGNSLPSKVIEKVKAGAKRAAIAESKKKTANAK